MVNGEDAGHAGKIIVGEGETIRLVPDIPEDMETGLVHWDISPLASMTEMEQLYLQNNRIRDISALSGMKNLIVLNISGNEVTDLSALDGLEIEELMT